MEGNVSGYYYYEHCHKCGGEYEGRAGATFDTYPASLPVKCKECGDETMAHPYESCIDMGWKDNRKNDGQDTN